MKILLTNQSLDVRAGTELFVQEIALMLRAQGHDPMAYTSRPGQVADLLRKDNIPVVNEIEKLPFKPDLIHAQHHLDAMSALLALPGVPAIYHCHGAFPWQERPPRHPRILRYLVTSEGLQHFISTEYSIDPEKIGVLRNFVDLSRFTGRITPLPQQPTSALVFVGGFNPEKKSMVSDACHSVGITKVDFAGYSVGNPIAHPEQILSDYDIVFATGRSAIEAIACGCAVIVMDSIRVGEFVTAQRYEDWRDCNYSIANTLPPMTSQAIATQLLQYNPVDAAAVCQRLRAEAGLDKAIEQLAGQYSMVMEEFENYSFDPESEMLACCSYIRSLTPLVQQLEAARPQMQLEEALLAEREKRRHNQNKIDLFVAKLKAAENAISLNPVLKCLTRGLRKEWHRLEREFERKPLNDSD